MYRFCKTAIQFLTVLLATTETVALPQPRQASNSNGPLVVLDYSTFQGASANMAGVEQFLGMPYAQPPIGNLRLRPPVTPPATVEGIVQATAFGLSCVQQATGDGQPGGTIPSNIMDMLAVNPLYASLTGGDSEDCLTINVMRPAGVNGNDSLPIVVWFYGGSFETGGTSSYPRNELINRSVQLGTPIIHISMNYRLNAYGFMPGQEVIDAGVGNLGLRDQRAGLRWVQKYAALFGGDPTKVTLFGESAGSVSVGSQIISNTARTENNFRAGFMDSGCVLPLGSLAQPGKQFTYDLMVNATNCTGAADTLQCLREAPDLAFRQAMDLSGGTFACKLFNSASTLNRPADTLHCEDGGLKFVYAPGYDDDFFTAPTQQILLAGNHSTVPVIVGGNVDEGTLFSLTQDNITTDADFLSYLKQVYLPTASDEDIATLAAAYPSDPAQGSPYNTGVLNQLYPQFKRVSSIQGDISFQATRRTFLSVMAPLVPAWSFLYARGKSTPFLGSFHSSDLEEETGAGDSTQQNTAVDNIYLDTLINFVNFMDPNSPANRSTNLSNLIYWPKWTPGGALFTFVDSESDLEGSAQNTSSTSSLISTPVPTSKAEALGMIITQDNFREEAMKVASDMFMKYPF